MKMYNPLSFVGPILLFFLMVSADLKSQSLIDETSKWYTVEGDVWDSWYCERFYEIVGDTVLGGNDYYEVEITKAFSELEQFGTDTISYQNNILSTRYIREDSSRFYTWAANTDYLVFDFNLQIGDSLYTNFGWDYIEEHDSMLVGTDYRNVFTTTWDRKIYEGIGTSLSFLEGMPLLGDEGFAFLMCYAYQGQNYEVGPGWTPNPFEERDCETLLVGIENGKSPIDFSVLPNPVQDFVILSLPYYSDFTVNVFNLQGQLEKTMNFNASDNVEIDVSNLASGIYLLQIDHDGKTGSKKLVKM